MGACFEVIFQMSLTASFVIAAVFLIRLLLRQAPRRYSYVLWLVVLIRLICPMVPETRFGAVPDIMRIFGEQQIAGEHAINGKIGSSQLSTGAMRVSAGERNNAAWFAGAEEIIVGSDIADRPVSGYVLQEVFSEEKKHAADIPEETGPILNIWWISGAAWNVVGWCWLCGCVIFFGYGIAGYLRLRYRMNQKEKQWIAMEENGEGKKAETLEFSHNGRTRILEDSEIGAPFTAGIFRPVICLPEGLLSFQREMVLAHENMHIRRQDNLLKLIAYAARCIHWFNPLVWLAFGCFEEDMEVSCDEAVLRKLGYERRKDYAKTLLALSECRREGGGLYPVSFGGKNMKGRIRNVLSAKKISLWAALVSTVVVAVAAAVLLVNHKPAQNVQEPAQNQVIDGQEPAQNQVIDGQEPMQDDQAADMQKEEQNDQNETADNGRMEEDFESEADRSSEEVNRGHAEELNTVKENIQIEMIQQTVRYKGYDEGEICLTDSEDYLIYTDGAIPVLHLDGGCSLLSNPQTGLEENGVTVTYFFPLHGIEDGSVLMSAVYGFRAHPVNKEAIFHSGLDFAAEEGTPILAAANGCVYRTGFDEENGNYVILIHANGELTYYAHCESVEVQAGDIVSCGQKIATVGNTGNSTGPHLHFAMSRQGAFVSPVFAGGSWSFVADSKVEVW